MCSQYKVTDSSLYDKSATFVVVPHIPGGMATPDQLRNIAALAEKYNGILKVANSSIKIIGLSVTNREVILNELDLLGLAHCNSILAFAVCLGKTYCRKAQQDSQALGLLLGRKLQDIATPRKVKIGISGCHNCCTDIFVKDIGMFGTAQGYTLVAGGNSGRRPRAGRILASGIVPEDVSSIIMKIFMYYQQCANEKERIGDMLDRVGWDDCIDSTIPIQYR